MWYCSCYRRKNCSFEEITFHMFDKGEASGKFDTNVLMWNLRIEDSLNDDSEHISFIYNNNNLLHFFHKKNAKADN